jgi:hypothetical protein
VAERIMPQKLPGIRSESIETMAAERDVEDRRNLSTRAGSPVDH